MMRRITLGMALVAGGIVWQGCGGQETSPCAATAEQGSLAITIYGEDFIEERIPAAEVSDGWEIRFEKFLVSLREVAATREHCPVAQFAAQQGWLFDLTAPSAGQGRLVYEAPTDAGRYTRVDYEIGPPSGEVRAGNASLQDLALMGDGGYAVYVAGEATHATKGTKRFAWGFSGTTRYLECESSAEVTGEVAGESELTIHGDHLFYDDLVAPEPKLAFDLIAAADSDDDGEITIAELGAQSIIGQARYGVGNYTEVEDLAQFIGYQVRTLGHIDGEGHCHAGD